MEKLGLICKAGKLPAVREHAEMVALKLGDYNILQYLRSDSCALLRYIGALGYFDIIQWLAGRFLLTDNDLRTALVFRFASFFGRQDVVQWLIDKYHPTIEDVRADNSFITRMAYMDSNLNLAELLIERFELTIGDITANNNEIINDAIENCRLDIFQAIVARWDVTFNPEWMKMLPPSGSGPFAQFIVDHYGIDTSPYKCWFPDLRQPNEKYVIVARRQFTPILPSCSE